MAKFDVGTWVWMPDEEEMFLPAMVHKAAFTAGSAGEVKTDDGEVHKLDAAVTKGMTACNEEVLSPKVDNLIKLNDLNEQALLHNLRLRFKQDIIYTYVSTILISVNPFKLLPLYTPEILEKYKSQGGRDLDPHVYAVGDNAYRQMLGDDNSQSVIISGESGAGKTEATKLILQFLAEVSGRAQATGEKSDGLEQQILQANPIMEAFGNAKTSRNNNSSRFGKLISVKFNKTGAIVGGSIINYLLEKVRVVKQTDLERNYHVFYQLLAGVNAHDDLKKELRLSGNGLDYHFTNQSTAITVDGISDEKEFEDVVNAMDTMNFDADHKAQIWRIVAGILFISNVEFEADIKATEEDGAKMKDASQEALENGAAMLGVDASALIKSLLTRNIGTRSVILVSYNAEQATDARDALCKHVYSKLFDSLIVSINKTLEANIASGAGAAGTKDINVLDIFGFESFETNSFEQLCINYCNEKLQFHFNEHIFKLEQQEYAAQGVSVPDTDFVDNQGTLDLLEKARTGVFSMIDEEISVPKGSDEGFLSKVFRDHGKDAHLKRPKPKAKDARLCFNVVHFAGEVSYNVTNFLDKNKDSLHSDIQSVVKASTSDYIKSLFAPPEGAAAPAAGRGARRQKSTKQPTLGAQFKKQLASLMDTLNSTAPHFIRTMKSNDAKKGDIFTCQRMLDQLRYAGLLEVCRIRQIGFPVRREFDSFFKRFRCLVDGAADLDSLCAKLTANGILKEGQWQKGKSKMFMRNLQATELETEREAAFTRQTVKVQRSVRALLMRVQYTRFKEILTNIKAAIASRDPAELQKWMDMSAELPHRGTHTSIVKEGRTLQNRLEEEARVDEMLVGAMKARLLEDCEAAIEAAQAMNPPYESDNVRAARDLLEKLRAELKLKQDLIDATKARDAAKLTSLIAEADAIPLDSEEVRQARIVKQRIDDEQEAIDSVNSAIESRSLSELNAWMSRMQELGLSERPEYAKGEALKKELTEINKARLALDAAMQERDMGTLVDAIAKARKVGVDSALLTKPLELEEQLKKEADANSALQAAADKRDAAAIKSAISTAEALKMTDATSNTLASAKALLVQLEQEEACRSALRDAASTGDATKLSQALGEASKLGLSGAEVDAARAAQKKLGDSSAARTELSDAAASGDAERIRKAMAQAAAAGEETCAEMTAAGAALDRLNEEAQTMKQIQRATQARDREVLSTAVATAGKMGLEKKFASEIAAAKSLEAELNEEHKLNLTLKAAQQSGNIEDIDAALAKADAAQVDNDVVKFTRKFKEVTADLTAALESKDSEALRAAVGKAGRYKVESDKVREARLLVDRDGNVAEANAAVAAAVESKNLHDLNNALEQATHLGLTGPAIDEAKTLQEELAKSVQSTQGVRSAIRATAIKAESAAGIAPNDITPLSTAIRKARESGIDDDNEVLSEALELEDKLNQQLEVQRDLAQAIGSRDYHELKNALDRSDDLVLRIDAVGKARDIMREVDAERRRLQAAGELEEEEIDEEEMERERQERLKKAANAKYHFTNFPGIRSVDDFAKGIILNKRKIKESMLKWQPNQIPKSLLEMDKDLSKLAQRTHKSILGYCGDKSMSFPATLAQDILQKGLDIPEMVDECYMLLMKHLTNNPKPESIARGWQLMCMCVGTFPPSREFENYLLNFVLEKKSSSGAVGNYAKYTLRRLEGMLSSGASGFVPSVEEIQAYKERPPILSTIELVDGTPLTEELPVTPDLNVVKVLEICTHFLDLQDTRSADFGIFVVDCDESDAGAVQTARLQHVDDSNPASDLPRTPRPLRGEDFMGDVVVQKARQGRPYKFVFKRKIYLRNLDESSEDEMFNRLIYLQAADEVITGNVPVSSLDSVVDLTAKSVAVDLGEDFPTDADGLVDAEVMEYVPMPWRHKFSDQQWAEKVLALRDYGESDPDQLQDDYVASVSASELYGTHFFHVQKANDVEATASLPERLIAAFNSEGLHFLDENRRILMSFGYADIYRWGGSSVQFSLIIWNADTQDTFEMILSTLQAADMAALILDFINAIMASTQG